MTQVEFFTDLSQDPKLKEVVKAVYEFAQSKGEDHQDDALDFIIGLLAQMYLDKVRAIANLEIIKHSLVDACMSYTAQEVGGALRKAGASDADSSRVA